MLHIREEDWVFSHDIPTTHWNFSSDQSNLHKDVFALDLKIGRESHWIRKWEESRTGRTNLISFTVHFSIEILGKAFQFGRLMVRNSSLFTAKLFVANQGIDWCPRQEVRVNFIAGRLNRKNWLPNSIQAVIYCQMAVCLLSNTFASLLLIVAWLLLQIDTSVIQQPARCLAMTLTCKLNELCFFDQFYKLIITWFFNLSAFELMVQLFVPCNWKNCATEFPGTILEQVSGI